MLLGKFEGTEFLQLNRDAIECMEGASKVFSRGAGLWKKEGKVKI